ncbi:MAG: S1 RNA-binding domain-containing protein [Butyrivibrio sp.]
MIELGKKQPLMVVNKTEFGVYLGNKDEKVLLPAKYADGELEPGDSVTVFVYRDSMDRLIATTLEPLITLGKVASLKVKQVNRIGAFLDWGLEKDLLLPFKEQTVKVSEGRKYPVALYVDKSGRLCATMKIYNYLRTDHSYSKGDTVRGTAYEKIDRFGMFVAVDDMYQGLIPNKELYGNLGVGDEIKATISRVHEDGKIELALRAPAYLQLDADCIRIYDALKRSGGNLPYNDQSRPEEIKAEFDMSKAAFKRACGHLLKEGKIQITDTGIIIK